MSLLYKKIIKKFPTIIQYCSISLSFNLISCGERIGSLSMKFDNAIEKDKALIRERLVHIADYEKDRKPIYSSSLMQLYENPEPFLSSLYEIGKTFYIVNSSVYTVGRCYEKNGELLYTQVRTTVYKRFWGLWKSSNLIDKEPLNKTFKVRDVEFPSFIKDEGRFILFDYKDIISLYLLPKTLLDKPLFITPFCMFRDDLLSSCIRCYKNNGINKYEVGLHSDILYKVMMVKYSEFDKSFRNKLQDDTMLEFNTSDFVKITVNKTGNVCLNLESFLYKDVSLVIDLSSMDFEVNLLDTVSMKFFYNGITGNFECAGFLDCNDRKENIKMIENVELVEIYKQINLRFKNPKEISLHFMLHLNENFDDDLLSDAIDLLHGE